MNSSDAEVREMGGRTVTVRPCGITGAPAVYVCMYLEVGEAVMRACRSLGCPPFDLVTVSGLDWNSDMSPWPHDQVTSGGEPFGGRAVATVSLLEEDVVPFAEEVLGAPAYRVSAGYSMAGLFSLYVPYVTGLFRAVASVSGSLWYPGFTDFVSESGFIRRPDAVYVSVGDRECKVRNPLMASTEDCARLVAGLYSDMGIPTGFGLNPGNHFRDAELRLAKGIDWLLRNIGQGGGQ